MISSTIQENYCLLYNYDVKVIKLDCEREYWCNKYSFSCSSSMYMAQSCVYIYRGICGSYSCYERRARIQLTIISILKWQLSMYPCLCESGRSPEASRPRHKSYSLCQWPYSLHLTKCLRSVWDKTEIDKRTHHWRPEDDERVRPYLFDMLLLGHWQIPIRVGWSGKKK